MSPHEQEETWSTKTTKKNLQPLRSNIPYNFFVSEKTQKLTECSFDHGEQHVVTSVFQMSEISDLNKSRSLLNQSKYITNSHQIMF